ncbi:MAG: type II toxin-antitoxin system VapC family toxin [Bacteroidota bacterium]
MKYLLDTHIIIWHGENNPALKPAILSLLNDPANELLVSHASLFEMAIKISTGKLQLGYPISHLKTALAQNGFQLLPFDFPHYQVLSSLPFQHNDPFDRMIISQALCENVEVITHDEKFKNYPISIVWA